MTAANGDRTPDVEKRPELNKKITFDGKKIDSSKNVDTTTTHFEKKFAELEAKIVELQTKLNSLADGSTAEKKTDTEEDDAKSEAAKEDEAKKKPPGRVRKVRTRVDDSGDRIHTDLDSDTPMDTTPTKTESAIVLFIDADGTDESRIEIHDPGLRDLLREKLAHYPNHWFIGDELFLRAPYEPLVLNWDLLQKESNEPTEDEKLKLARSDLRLLLDLIRDGAGDAKLKSYFSSREGLMKQKSITFETLWTIFAPGTIIWAHVFLRNELKQQDQIFIVEDNFWAWPRESRGSGRNTRWSIACWTYDLSTSGKSFQRRRLFLDIPKFEGSKPITTLPFYPLSAKPEEEQKAIREALFERGKKFRMYCTRDRDHRLHEYTGEAVVDEQEARLIRNPFDFDSDQETSFPRDDSQAQLSLPLNESNVMVDYESYFRYGRNAYKIGNIITLDEVNECLCAACSSNEALKQLFKPYYDDDESQDGDWEPLQYMLCPPRVLGYVLKEKRWAQLAVSFLADIREESYSEVMKRLHLSGKNSGEEKKALLYKLVETHGLSQSKINDLVAEKGKGLVFLLYGAPGVGKTSTAQMVARAARKPLFSIGVADVGTNAKDVESNLQRIFDLAAIWRAILLIDEADVFLQSRSMSPTGPSAEGSALVSVFLRVLEYYSGILFLTTNQIAQFDVAVQSRVHIALKYDRLDEDQTYKIFTGFIDQYKQDGKVDRSEYKAIDRFAERDLYRKEFDGRQIRNIVTSAMGYARGQDEKLNMEHISHVVGYVEDFQKDLAGQMRAWHEKQKSTRN